MKRFLTAALFLCSASSAYADTYNYVCKDHGKSIPLRVDDRANTLGWKGAVYGLKETEDCAKFGWRAVKGATAFDFCTATQGYASFQLDGVQIECGLKR